MGSFIDLVKDVRDNIYTDIKNKYEEIKNYTLTFENASKSSLSAANFKGKYSDLSGGLSIPASVSLNGDAWLLDKNLSDVTQSVPSLDNSDWMLITKGTTTISTVSKLQSLLNPISKVWVSGYHTKGDGSFGSNIHEWDPESIEEPIGGIIIKLDNSPIGRYKLKFSGAIQSKWFNFLGDNSDETAKFQSFVNMASPDVKLEGEPITVRISSPINLPNIDGMDIDFKQMKLVANKDDIPEGSYYFKNSFTTTTMSHTLTADIAINDTSATFDSVTGLSVGDLISVTGKGHSNNGGVSIRGHDGDIFIIKSISGTTVTFTEPFSVNILVSDFFRLTKYETTKNIRLSNLEIVVAGTREQAIELRNIQDSELVGINISAVTTGLIALSVQNSSNVLITGCNIRDFIDLPAKSYGYGVVCNGRYINVKENLVEGCKHNITSGSSIYASRAINYIRNITSGANMASLDYHYNVINSEMVGNYVYTSALGINLRSQGKVKVLNNFVESSSTSIFIYADINSPTVNNSGVTSDILIQGNTLITSSSNTSRVIECAIAADILENIKVLNNTITAYSDSNLIGMNQQQSKDFLVQGNTITGGGLCHFANGITFDGNTLHNPINNYIMLMANNDNADNVVVTNNKVYGLGSKSFIRATEGKNITYYGNELHSITGGYPLNISIPANIKASVTDFGIRPSGDDCSVLLELCVTKYELVENNGLQSIYIEFPQGNYVIDGSFNFSQSKYKFYSYGTVTFTGANTTPPTVKNLLV